MKKTSFLLAVLITIFWSCKNSQEEKNQEKSLDTLFSMMQGSYNSETQAKSDSTYYNISLHMYPIWEGKGNWLYVEQAVNSMQDKPYRQRLYEVKQLSDSTFASYIYTIQNDSLWIGKWKTPKDFDSLKLTDIALRKGCEVILTKTNDSTFSGRTGDKTCESSLRGASFATSEVEMLPNKIISWDRGFDANGNHVWGAEKGGYIFEKLK